MSDNIETVDKNTIRVYGRSGAYLQFECWTNGQGEQVVTVGLYGPQGGHYGSTLLAVGDLRQAIDAIIPKGTDQ